MNVLFVHNWLQPFVRTDLRLIEENHSVTEVNFRWSPSCVLRLLLQVRRCDLVFGWFAGHHLYPSAELAKTLGKRVIVASSDYDLANEPWFEYGSMRGGFRKWIGNRVFSLADFVLVPSEFSRKLALQNTVLNMFPERVRIMPHGFEPTLLPTLAKEKIVVTAGGLNAENWIRKGHREFVEVARRTPATKFYLVGRPVSHKFLEWVRSQSPPNLDATGFLEDRHLSNLLARAKVYLQLSYMEGFGCSVAEAMLAGCVPVVSRSGSLPEVVGECGYYVDYGDIPGACAAVQAALEDPRMAGMARKRILDNFPTERRREALQAILNELIGISDGRKGCLSKCSSHSWPSNFTSV